MLIGCVSKPLYPGPILVYFCNLGPGPVEEVVGAKPLAANSSETKKKNSETKYLGLKLGA